MTQVVIPPALHDVLGKYQSQSSLVLVGSVAVIAVIATTPALANVPLWRGALAALLIADIAAGAIANVTEGTNDHYASRPRSRWVFLGVHLHLPIVALLLGAPVMPALVVWATTIAAGSIVNLLAGRASQRVAAGAAFTAIVCLVLIFPEQPPELMVVSVLFAFKVVYAFAVDHSAIDYRAVDESSDSLPGVDA